jgi:hypothetical protein
VTSARINTRTESAYAQYRLRHSSSMYRTMTVSGSPLCIVEKPAVVVPMTPSGMRGVLNDAISIYFADVTLASAFVARWCVGSKVETTGGVFQVREDEPAPRVGAGLRDGRNVNGRHRRGCCRSERCLTRCKPFRDPAWRPPPALPPRTYNCLAWSCRTSECRGSGRTKT